MHEMTKVVCGLLLHNNKVYLPKRAKTLKYYPDFYEFPGGKVEQNENNLDALKRELYEELSIIVKDCDIIPFPGNNIINNNIDLTCYLVTYWTNNIKINPNINSELIKLDIKELHNVNELLETDKLLINTIYKFLNI